MKKFNKNKKVSRIAQLHAASNQVSNIFKEMSKSLDEINTEIQREATQKNELIATLQRENEDLAGLLSSNLTMKSKIDNFLGVSEEAVVEEKEEPAL